MSGEVSTSTRVVPPSPRRETRIEQRKRRFFGLAAPPPHGPADATPLAGLPLLLLDTETTGLDPARDRVVALAALPWRGRAAEAPGLDTLIDPGCPIR